MLCMSFRRTWRGGCGVYETIVNVVNDPKRRASPRRNYKDQHPLAERPKCSTTRVSVEDKNSHDNKRPRQSRSQANGAGTPPKVVFTAGLDAPILTGPAGLVEYISSLSKTTSRRKA